MKLLLPKGWDRRGGPLWVIVHFLQAFHDIEPEVYGGQSSGVFLGYNILPSEVKSGVRKVILVGGCKITDNGVPRPTSWKKIDMVVFNSYFIKSITESVFKISRSQVIYLVGGVPADPNLAKPSKSSNPFNIDAPQFMCCAKWWKRSFKRQRQTVHFFNEYVLPTYPNAKLHVLGNKISKTKNRDNVVYYRKSFHDNSSCDVYKIANVQLIFTPFDTGPLTLTESLHYRVPFVCSQNCCGPEVIELLTGDCGIATKIDPRLVNAKHCCKYQPMTNRRFYDKELPYDRLLGAVNEILLNFERFTSWLWSDGLNYEAQAEKWMKVLYG